MGLKDFVQGAIASVSRFTGRKRKASDQEEDDRLEPPVPTSTSRPRLAAHPLPPQQGGPVDGGPLRLDFSSPAVNGQQQLRGRAAGGGATKSLLPTAIGARDMRHQGGAGPAAPRRLDATLGAAAAAEGGMQLGGQLNSGRPPSVGAAPFTKVFAQPAPHVSRISRGASPMFNTLIHGLRQVREASPSSGKLSLTPGTALRRPAQAQQALGQVQGLFTGSRAAKQQQQQQQGKLPWQRAAAAGPRQRLPPRPGSVIEMQPMGASARRVGGGGATAGFGHSPTTSQMQDAVMLKHVVDVQLRREELIEQQQQQQQQPPAPARVEEVDLTWEPSSSQQPPRAQLPQRGQQQQQRQQGHGLGHAVQGEAAAQQPAAAPSAPARPALIVDWRKRMQEVVAAARVDAFDDMSSDTSALTGPSELEKRCRETAEASALARRKALQADERQLQLEQAVHTALEQAQPQRAQRAEAELQQLQQQLQEIDLQRKQQGAGLPYPQQHQLSQAPAPTRQQKAAAGLAAGDQEDLVELLSSDEEEPAPSASMAAAASEEEESEVSQQLERVALEEDEFALVIQDAWREEYHSVLDPGPPGEVLVDHPLSSIQITRRDMACMARLQWLNDEVINLYISLLLERDAARRKEGVGDPRCHFFSTFFANKLYKDTGYKYDQVRRWTMPKKLKNGGQASDSILDVDRIVVPVHQGMHWVCAVIDLQHRKFVYYDSLKGEDHRCLEHLAEYLRDEYRNKRGEERDDVLDWPREFPKRIPQQKNGCDCGVFTLLFANHAGRGAPMAFCQEQIDDWRVRIVHELLTLSVA